MADEVQNSTPAQPAAVTESAPVATPQSDPTPAQVESTTVVKDLSDDIDGLWSKLDGLRVENQKPETPEPEAPRAEETPEPLPDLARQRDDKGRFVKAEATPDTTPPVEAPPSTDQATLDQQAYERAKADLEARQVAERAAQERIEAEQRFEAEVGHYAGRPSDRHAVEEALREFNLGNAAPLAALDVTLPNGKKVSEIVRSDGSTAPGLTAAEAQNLAVAWGQADKYGDALAGRKIQQLIGYWDQQTQQALTDPDVDAAKVRTYRTPGEQIKAAIETTRDRVTARLAEAHQKAIAEKDAEIGRLTERVSSLVNERGNLASQQQAAGAATPDRPGQPGAARRDLPTPDQLHEMSAEEAFKSGAIDRLLQILPGGASPLPRRRTG